MSGLLMHLARANATGNARFREVAACGTFAAMDPQYLQQLHALALELPQRGLPEQVGPDDVSRHQPVGLAY